MQAQQPLHSASHKISLKQPLNQYQQSIPSSSTFNYTSLQSTSITSQQQTLQDHFPTQAPPSRITIITQTSPNDLIVKLKQFSKLAQREKLEAIDNITVILDIINNNNNKNINGMLDILADWISNSIQCRKNPTISSKFLTKIQDIINYLQSHTSLNTFQSLLKSLIIPTITSYLIDQSQLGSQDFNSKQQASKYLINICSKLPQVDHGQYILKYILLLAHDDNNQINRTIAVQMLGKICKYIDHNLCEQFIVLQIISLGDDVSQNVRKQAIKILPQICAVVSSYIYNHKVLPYYYEKCKDSKNWAIRKTCADIIIDIVKYAKDEDKYNKLSKIMLEFLNDKNKWVKLSAYLNLGKFIYQLKGLEIHKKLVDKYLSMAQTSIINLGLQNQIPYNCAYNFPAVLSALGSEAWQQLQPLYHKLLTFVDRKIKLTLSSSLHQIAKIIGGAKTQKYLFSIINKFLQDQNDEIKLGIIQRMYEILFVLNDRKREQMIIIFQQYEKNMKKWRVRVSIIKQFQYLLEMYSVDLVHIYLLPILLSFCSDSVAIVRQQAAKIIPCFVQSFQHDIDKLRGLLQSIKGYRYSNIYMHRLQFIQICRYLIPNFKLIFYSQFMEILMELRHDKIVNVRLVVVQLICDMLSCINNNEQSCNNIGEKYNIMDRNNKKQKFTNEQEKQQTYLGIINKLRQVQKDIMQNGEQQVRQILLPIE